uniref:Proline rich 15 like a n=2 Tax=Gasterosteus aculeatus TaxID=69293 RepID=A0AAQ4RLI9_GASAC|nr:proline-rich protein 15-like protein A [Gasterosteus aculeatus aculeatus]
MAEPSPSWWELTFLRRKKSQPKVQYEIPAALVTNATAQHGYSTGGAALHSEEGVHHPQLDARLERIMDKTLANKGRHVKVSHSGRFKEKKKVRAALAENTEILPGGGAAKDENHPEGH